MAEAEAKAKAKAKLPLIPLIPSWALAIDVSILRDRAGKANEAPRGWKHQSNGFLLGGSIANYVAHDTKKRSLARAQEGINTKGNILDR